MDNERESTTFAGVVDEWSDTFRDIVEGGIAVVGLGTAFTVYKVGSFFSNIMANAGSDALMVVAIIGGVPILTTSGIVWLKRHKVKSLIDQGVVKAIQMGKKPAQLQANVTNLVEGVVAKYVDEEIVEEEHVVPAAPTVVSPVTQQPVDAVSPMFDLLEEPRHLLVLSGTGSGKTIFVREMMEHMIRNYQQSKYVVIDLKPNDFPDEVKWPNARHIIKDATEAGQFIVKYYDELKRRMDNGGHSYPLFYLVIDELSMLAPDSSVTEAIIKISNLGRHYRMKIIMLSQTGTVSAIGFSGSQPTLQKNFTSLVLENGRNGRVFHTGNFHNGVISAGENFWPIPEFDCSWQDVGDLPMYDTAFEDMMLFGATTPAIVRNGNGNGNDNTSTTPEQSSIRGVVPRNRDVVTGIGNTTVDNLSAFESYVDGNEEYHRNIVESLVENLQDRDVHVRKLTEGQAIAIYYMDNAGFSKSEICNQLFDGKRGRNYQVIDQALATL